MSETADRQRIDVWLWRARLAKTRAGAARLVAEGGVRVLRGHQARRLDKASATITIGDVLVLPNPRGLRTLRITGLGLRRGPAVEARALYVLIEAPLIGDIDGVA